MPAPVVEIDRDDPAEAAIEADRLRARALDHAARHDRLMLVLAALAVVFAFLLEVRSNDRVAFRFLPDRPLPHSCAARSRLGVDCPGCGLTRSFVELAHADPAAAWSQHRLGPLMALTALFQLPYRTLALARPHRRPIPFPLTTGFGVALIVLLLANWLAGLALGVGN